MARFGKRIARFIFNNPLNNDYIDNDDSANYSDVDGNNNNKKTMVRTQE